MALGIAIIVAVVIVIIIAAFFLLRPAGSRYARMADKELRNQNYIPPAPEDEPRPRAFKVESSSSLTPLIMGILRAAIGLAALVALVIIYTKTQNALQGVTTDATKTALYSEGIFKAVITLGIAAALYIFTRFHR